VTPLQDATVIGIGGWRGRLRSAAGDEAEPQVPLELDDGATVLVMRQALVRQKDGTYYVPLTRAELSPPPVASPAASESIVVPLVVEELRVERERVQTGNVRVAVGVQEREEVVDEPVIREEVTIERVPINRPVAEALPIRHEGLTTIVPIVEEVLIVEKRLVLKEEIHITKRRVETREPQKVVLRSETATVERLDLDDPPEAVTLPTGQVSSNRTG
jgi:uncharacterized protein (TIGR02271 family)